MRLRLTNIDHCPKPTSNLVKLTFFESYGPGHSAGTSMINGSVRFKFGAVSRHTEMLKYGICALSSPVLYTAIQTALSSLVLCTAVQTALSSFVLCTAVLSLLWGMPVPGWQNMKYSEERGMDTIWGDRCSEKGDEEMTGVRIITRLSSHADSTIAQ